MLARGDDLARYGCDRIVVAQDGALDLPALDELLDDCLVVELPCVGERLPEGLDGVYLRDPHRTAQVGGFHEKRKPEGPRRLIEIGWDLSACCDRPRISSPGSLAPEGCASSLPCPCRPTRRARRARRRAPGTSCRGPAGFRLHRRGRGPPERSRPGGASGFRRPSGRERGPLRPDPGGSFGPRAAASGRVRPEDRPRRPPRFREGASPPACR